jgi:hypothetical protein
MIKHSFRKSWLLVLSFLFTLSTANVAWPQTSLQRLENQIRQRVGKIPAPPPPESELPPTKAAAPETKTAGQAEKKEPGFLGVIADDRQDRGRGVRVLELQPNGPAAKGGLKKQDLITSVAGVRTRQMSEMSDVLNLYAAGETIEFDILRENKPQKVKVTLEKRSGQKNAEGQVAEAIPLPPGEIIASEPQQEPEKNPAPSEKANKPSILELFKLKSTPSGEKKPAESDDAASPRLIPPRPAAPEERPTVEQLQQRVEELERRVTELEKALKESKKAK